MAADRRLRGERVARYGDAWEEIGRIDFLLDDLARAVERGEIPRESYDAIAPRHLARRTDLIAEIEQAREAWSRPAQQQTVSTPAVQGAQATHAASGVASRHPHTTGPGIAPRRHREVRWTQVLAYTGAFLVVVAAAIFTVAVWEAVSTTAKLAFLGVFTAAFYGAGVWVWRAGLKGGGVALTAVGSAMLLFDGWIAIDGYGLDGPWPWAALFLALSAVYWFTETRLTGRFFGATGAAAQVGWWWLLGQGLGWTVAPRLAGIALIAAGWTLVAGAVRERPGFSSLAAVLRIAGPVTVALAVAGLVVDLAIGPPRWVDAGSAALVAAAATVVADRIGSRWRGIAALGWLPLLLAILVMTEPGTTWPHVIALAAVALAAGAYELLRGGTGHGIVALLAEVAAWLALADRLRFADDATLSLLIVVAAVWLVAARVLREGIEPGDPLAPHATAFAPVVAAGGWILLAGVTLFLPVGIVHALGSPWALPIPRETALVVIFTLGWASGARVMKAWPAAVVTVAGSLLTVGVLLQGVAPDLHVAFLWCALVATAAAWLHLPRVAEGLNAPWVGRAASWVVGGFLFLAGTALWLVAPGEAGWPVVALMAAIAALWFSETARHGTYVPGSAAVGVIVVAATLVGDLLDVGQSAVGSAGGGLLGTGVATLLCGGMAALAHIGLAERAVRWWTLPAAGVGSIAALWPSVMLLGPRHDHVAPALAATFAILALAWAASAVALRTVWLVSASALSLWIALLSLFAWLEAPPALTTGALTLFALALFAPSVFRDAGRTEDGGGLSPLAPPLALVSLAVGAGTVLLGLQSYAGIGLWAGWADIGAWGLTVALVALGAILVLGARLYSIEPAEYAGTFCVVASAWVILDTAGIGVIQPYLVLFALYIAGSSYRYAALAPGRQIPVVADWAAVVSAAWLSALLAVSAHTPADALTHSIWAVGIALAFIAAGVVLRVRGYLFGGVAALVFVSVWRSFFLLVEFWWVVLGLIGIAMLVIALTWERQQLLLARTGRMVREYLGGWR